MCDMMPMPDNELIKRGFLKVDSNGNHLYEKPFEDIEIYYAYDEQNRVVKETMVSCGKETVIADKSYDDFGYITTNSVNISNNECIGRAVSRSFNNRIVYYRSAEEEYFTFAHAVELLYSGKNVTRKAYDNYSYVKQVVIVDSIEDEGIEYRRVFMLMKKDDNTILNDNWKIPTEDVMASDWILVEE